MFGMYVHKMERGSGHDNKQRRGSLQAHMSLMSNIDRWLMQLRVC